MQPSLQRKVTRACCPTRGLPPRRPRVGRPALGGGRFPCTILDAASCALGDGRKPSAGSETCFGRVPGRETRREAPATNCRERSRGPYIKKKRKHSKKRSGG